MKSGETGYYRKPVNTYLIFFFIPLYLRYHRGLWIDQNAVIPLWKRGGAEGFLNNSE